MHINPAPIPMTCTDTELVVHLSLPELARRPDVLPHVPDLIEKWLHAHGLEISDVAIGRPITRDPENRMLRWTGLSDDRAMCDPVRALVEKSEQQLPPRTLGDPLVWPAPFPKQLLEASEHIAREHQA